MENRSGSSTIFVFLIGIAIGVAITILFGMILYYIEGETLSIEPKTFGDIKVWATKVSGVKDVSKMMFMAKADTPFLSVHMDKVGKVAHLSLLDEKERVCFTMTASTEPSKWEHIIYGGYNEAGIQSGEMFVDINFDGHFDTRNVLDGSGKKVSRYIYIDQIWQQVTVVTLEKRNQAKRHMSLTKTLVGK